MEDDKNNQEMAKFQQEFRADVQQSLNAAEELAVNQKRTKNKIIVIIAIAVTLIIVAVMIGMIIVRRGRGESASVEQSQGEEEVAMAFDAETSMIGVLVAPSSAKIMIGGSQYKNGKYEISPGKYEVLIEKEGFEPYSGEITVEDKHISYVTACLQPVNEGDNYYNENEEDASICQSYEELVDTVAWDQLAMLDEIFDYAPIHNKKEGYYVDPYFNENGDLIVKLSFKDCAQTEAVLEKRAYDSMREEGLNPDNYVFEKVWDCEEL